MAGRQKRRLARQERKQKRAAEKAHGADGSKVKEEPGVAIKLEVDSNVGSSSTGGRKKVKLENEDKQYIKQEDGGSMAADHGNLGHANHFVVVKTEERQDLDVAGNDGLSAEEGNRHPAEDSDLIKKEKL